MTLSRPAQAPLAARVARRAPHVRQPAPVAASVPRQDYEKDEMAAEVPVMERSLSYLLEEIETSHNSRSGAVMSSLNVAFVRCVGDPVPSCWRPGSPGPG
ncbi:hypothetical protein GCM10010341_67370 [Streptomyces noursei]|nr:hypothetical protein GCM10010341_67370 [Streptomyces noursei]